METLSLILASPLAPPFLLLLVCAPFFVDTTLFFGREEGCNINYYPGTNGIKAFELLKDWSNYLLVTTVAALGWVSTSNDFGEASLLKMWCIWSLTLSVVFGMFTLALIPLATEIYKPGKSIYNITPAFQVFGNSFTVTHIRIKHVCRPQHVLFMIGIVIYGAAMAT